VTPIFRRFAVAALFVVLLLASGSSATAAIRTGTVPVLYPDKPLSADFPGLGSLTLRYEDSDGSMELAATLRSPLADPQVTSALRQTRISVTLGDFYGDDMSSDFCKSWEQG
jgi:hypothetical protein